MMDKWAKSGLLNSFFFSHFFYKNNNDTNHSSKLINEIVTYNKLGYTTHQISDKFVLSGQMIRRTIKNAKKDNKKKV